MSLVNYETGEVIEYDRAAAERRAERIQCRRTRRPQCQPRARMNPLAPPPSSTA